MSFATVQSINLDKAMSDISGESLVIVTKTVESSAYLNKDRSYTKGVPFFSTKNGV